MEGAHRDVVVVGGSAGAIEALGKLVGQLPADLDAAVFVVIHVAPYARSQLPAILNRLGPLPAAQAADREPIRTGRIYVATPDRHLLVDGERIRVTRGPRENGHRPALDTLFRSAARSAGPRVIGVVLSGALDDGTVGIAAIKRAGGTAIVQSDGAFDEMPANAMRGTAVDHAVPLVDIADLICALVAEPLDTSSSSGAYSDRPDPLEDAPAQASERGGESIDITCPECGGALWEIGPDPLRFRCRVGHAYGVRSLVSGNSAALEQALWTALRALEERSALMLRIAKRFSERGNDRDAERYREDSAALLERAEVVRSALLDPDLDANTG